MKTLTYYSKRTTGIAAVISFLYFGFSVTSCAKLAGKQTSIEVITDEVKKDSLFKNLVKITGDILPEGSLSDSLSFLILPIQASCPSCRRKTIDSIAEHQNRLPVNHFVVISANGGRKTISAFFKEQGKELDPAESRILLDSTNQASKYDLYYDKPTIYYATGGKVYKKVAAIPSTVKEDLREFFSGTRLK